MRPYSLVLLVMILSIFVLSACVHTHTVHKIPPGQAKKMTGAKSAKQYAPGQQKKRH